MNIRKTINKLQKALIQRGKDREICLYHTDAKIVFMEYITMKIAVMKMVVLIRMMMNAKNYFKKMIEHEHP